VTSSDIGTVMPLHYKLINHKRSQNNENKKLKKIEVASDVVQLSKTAGDNVLLKHNEEEIPHLINTLSNFCHCKA